MNEEHTLQIMADGGEIGSTSCGLWQMVVKVEHTLQIMADGYERWNTRCRLWQMVVKEGTHVADYDSLLPRSPLLNIHSRLQNEGSRTRTARSADHLGNQSLSCIGLWHYHRCCVPSPYTALTGTTRNGWPIKSSVVLLRYEKETVQPSNSFISHPKFYTLASRVVRDGNGGGCWELGGGPGGGWELGGGPGVGGKDVLIQHDLPQPGQTQHACWNKLLHHAFRDFGTLVVRVTGRVHCQRY